jgi:hypothetical protein
MTNLLLNFPISQKDVPNYQLDDKKYFEENPDKRFNIRPIYDGEIFDEHMQKTLTNEKKHVIVIKLTDNFRIRFPVHWPWNTPKVSQEELETIIAAAFIDRPELCKTWGYKLLETESKIKILHPKGVWMPRSEKLPLHPEDSAEMLSSTVPEYPPTIFEFNMEQVYRLVKGDLIKILDDSQEAWKAGLLQLPFEHVVFTTTEGEWLHCIQVEEDITVATSLYPLRMHNGITAEASLEINQTLKYEILDFGMILQEDVKNIDDEARRIITRMLVFCFLLSAKNIELKTRLPHKKHVKRAKKAKLPILPQNITQVILGRPILHGQGTKQHHASPRIHLRRAHLRRLKSDRFKTKKCIWIPPMLIGAKDESEQILSKHYKVKV